MKKVCVIALMGCICVTVSDQLASADVHERRVRFHTIGASAHLPADERGIVKAYKATALGIGLEINREVRGIFSCYVRVSWHAISTPARFVEGLDIFRLRSTRWIRSELGVVANWGVIWRRSLGFSGGVLYLTDKIWRSEDEFLYREDVQQRWQPVLSFTTGIERRLNSRWAVGGELSIRQSVIVSRSSVHERGMNLYVSYIWLP